MSVIEAACDVAIVVLAAIGLATVDAWARERARVYLFKRGGRP